MTTIKNQETLTTEEYIKKYVTRDNWQKYFDDIWMHHLQDNLGLNGDHVCLGIDVYVKYIVRHLLAQALTEHDRKLENKKNDIFDIINKSAHLWYEAGKQHEALLYSQIKQVTNDILALLKPDREA